MTNNQSIFHKAIERAIKGGWDVFGHKIHPKFKWDVYEALNTKELKLSVSYQNEGTMLRDYAFETVLFNAGFADGFVDGMVAYNASDFLHDMAVRDTTYRLDELEILLVRNK
jgi:hypothetical protein